MAAERPGIRDQTQLFFDLASGSTPSLQEIDRLFDSGQADQSRAYQLSRVLVWDLLRKHGQTSGGRILGLVGQGIPFETAFKDVTGQTTAVNRGRVLQTSARLDNMDAHPLFPGNSVDGNHAAGDPCDLAKEKARRRDAETLGRRGKQLSRREIGAGYPGTDFDLCGVT